MASEGTSVTVRYFAAAAESAGREEETVTIVPPTVGTLRTVLVERYGAGMERVLANGSFLIDGVAARGDATEIRDRADVLPPFAGG